MGALDSVRRHDADLIVLDLGLPDVDGLEVIKRIRYAQSGIPIIILSDRGDEAAKVAALDLGADDYVTKPFGIEELLARIRMLQRHRVQLQTDQSLIQAGDLRLNLLRRTATIRDLKVRLSPREFALPQLLASHAGKVLTHNFILRMGCRHRRAIFAHLYPRPAPEAGAGSRASDAADHRPRCRLSVTHSRSWLCCRHESRCLRVSIG
jgi:DNA-binding response OmpR family regulator